MAHLEEEVLGIQQDTSWTSFLLVGRFLPLLVWHCLATFELRLHSLVAVAFHLPPVLQGHRAGQEKAEGAAEAAAAAKAAE